MRVVKNLFAFLFCITLTLTLIAIGISISFQKLIQKDTIQKMLIDVDIELLLNNKNGNQIYDILEQTGLPKEYVNEILEDKTLKTYVSTYIAKSVEYVVYQKKLPQIEEKEIETILVAGFQTIVSEIKKNPNAIPISDEEEQKIENKIKEYTPKIVENIPKIETLLHDKIEQSETLSSGAKMIATLQEGSRQLQKYYRYQYVLFIAAAAQMLILLGIKWYHAEVCHYYVGSFLMSGVAICFLGTFVSKFVERIFLKIPEFPLTILDPLLIKTEDLLNQAGILFILIALLFFIIDIGFILIRKINLSRKINRI